MTTVRIRFEKVREASYISLLDMQRVMQRVLKRSGLPVWYTLGFNPHIYMTFSCPLPLGQESLCESVDVKTEAESIDGNGWKEALNRVMPAGICVYEVAPAEKKADLIAFADYTVRYSAMAAPLLEQYNALESAPIEKKSKHAVKTIDLKEYAAHLALEKTENAVQFSLRLPASGTMTVNPALLTSFLQDQLGVPASDAAILRTGLFTQDGEKF